MKKQTGIITYVFCIGHMFGLLLAEASLFTTILAFAIRGYKDNFSTGICILIGLTVHCLLLMLLTKRKVIGSKTHRVLLWLDGLVTYGVSLLIAILCGLGYIKLPFPQVIFIIAVNACILLICAVIYNFLKKTRDKKTGDGSVS